MTSKAEHVAVAAEGTRRELSEWHAAQVALTVVALRAKGAKVAAAELARLSGRLDELDDQAHAEISQAIYRVADQLLHTPAVQARQLARSMGSGFCETALRVLFDLDENSSCPAAQVRP
jgi:glutamyl-tRNA reductase